MTDLIKTFKILYLYFCHCIPNVWFYFFTKVGSFSYFSFAWSFAKPTKYTQHTAPNFSFSMLNGDFVDFIRLWMKTLDAWIVLFGWLGSLYTLQVPRTGVWVAAWVFIGIEQWCRTGRWDIKDGLDCKTRKLKYYSE